ncbi:hypothetical protein KFE25_010233 [Diacronema lutheri]|uniref:Amino acid transporter n=1 Tax=Diacronema lutheri TaxID=2081491 RepID=A0A8J5XKX1_DIALT|nr:hypothetical protein KFE25_010233 [Diacronema lutheri]
MLPNLKIWRSVVSDDRGPPSFGGQQLSNEIEDAVPVDEDPPARAGGRGLRFVQRNFSLLTMAGCAVGMGVGYGARAAGIGDEGVVLLGYVGELFVRSLKAPLSPMIFCSMIVCTNLHAHTASASAPKYAVACYALTTVLASTIGVVAFVVFRPGSHTHLSGAPSPELSLAAEGTTGPAPMLDSLLDLGRELVPDNMLKAMVEMKLLSVITAGVSVGVAIRHTAPLHPEATAPLLAMAKGVFEALLTLIGWLVLFAPLGVFSMVAACVATTPDLATVAAGLAACVLTSAAGMAFHVLGSLSLLLLLAAPAERPSPWRFLKGIAPAISMAFGTASSAATLSTTLKSVVAQGVRRPVAAFVLPLGATVNMDGSAIGITCSVLFLANASGQLATMNALQVANVGLVSALLSVGAAPVPSSGLITLILCMEATGVAITPLTAYVLAIDWLTDRMRTVVNVASDAFVCATVDRLILRAEKRAAPAPTDELRSARDADARAVSATRGGGAADLGTLAGAPVDAPPTPPLHSAPPAPPVAASALELGERRPPKS